MRVAPWEEPRSWPRRKRSRPMTFRPRSASERAAAEPWAPSPTTTTSVRSTGGPGGTARLPFDRARAGRAMSATPSSSASRSPSDVYTCGAARTTAARSRPARSHRPWPAGTETSCTARSARASATSRGSAPSTRNVTSAPRAAGGSARVTPGISARPARSRAPRATRCWEIASMPSAWASASATPRPRRSACDASQVSKRRAVASRLHARSAVQVAPRTSGASGSRRSSSSLRT